MAESKRERRGHFRGKPRPGRRVEVRYRVVDASGTDGPEHLAFTKNIGVGGAFILTPDPPHPGAKLQIALVVPQAKTIEVEGEVRWIVDGKHDEPAPEHGMGVRFHGLDVDQLLALNEYFASLTSTLDLDDA